MTQKSHFLSRAPGVSVLKEAVMRPPLAEGSRPLMHTANSGSTMMAMMELNRHAAIDVLAEDVFSQLREHLTEGGAFFPVLFLHRIEGPGEPALIEMLTLEAEDQDTWGGIIESAVDRTSATLWALATQVLVRRTSAATAETTEELLFVYMVADAAQPQGARIWAAELDTPRRLVSSFQERTGDPKLQLMVQHLAGRHLLH